LLPQPVGKCRIQFWEESAFPESLFRGGPNTNPKAWQGER